MKIYDFKVKDVNGEDFSLQTLEGKVLLIVNTATGCGFTPQYEGLQKLYEKYHDEGLEILDFPCNQFGNQAPGSNKDIHDFCTLNYHTTFLRFAKILVNGEFEDPLYTFLKKESGGLFGKDIKWNFTKFLIDRSGYVVKRYPSTVTPEKIAKDIVKYL